MTLNDKVDNGIPRLPGALTPNPNGGIARQPRDTRDSGDSARKIALIRGASWCVAAGLCALWASPLVALLGGYGTAQATARGGRRERIACAVCLVAADVVSAIVAWLFIGPTDGVSGLLGGLVPSAIAFAVGCMVAAGTPSFGALAACVLVSGALYGGAAQCGAVVQGTNVADQFRQLLGGLVSQGTLLSQTSALSRLVPFLSMLWPAFYVGQGFIGTVIAHLGARMALRREHVAVPDEGRFARYDVPLWVVGTLLAGIVCLVVGGMFPAVSGVAYALGWNVIMIVRFAFAAQGFAVLEWVLDTRHAGVVLRVLSVAALAYAEVSFFVMSVVGVVDVWANFRYLRRGAAPADGAQGDGQV